MPEFTHPGFLLLLLVAAGALLLGQRRSLADLSPAGRRACLLTRGALLGCLALALAGPRWRSRAEEALGVVFAVDASASIGPEARAAARAFVEASLAARRPGDAAGIVGFAQKPALWLPPTTATRPLPAAAFPEIPEAERAATDLGRALDFAGAALPPEVAGRRVVLLTDGNDTAGTAREAAARLRGGVAGGGDNDGVELWTVPLRNPDRPEALVESLEVPRTLAPGETFDARVTLRANVATRARVNLYADRFLADHRDDVAVQKGTTEIVFPNLRAPAGGGLAGFEAEILPEADTLVENNRIGAVAALAGAPRVLLVDGDERTATPLADALRAEKIDVDLRGPAGLPTTLEDLQRFDLLLLSDVSALGLGRETMELYRRWVSDFGGGFALLGGENSFGVGGYYRTPIETMLPVRLEHDDRQETPTVALLVVLDRSGSMTATVSGQTKISLADQGAILALNVLGPRDLFGLTAVDTVVRPVVPMGPVTSTATSRAAAAERIAAIDAGGGGIYIYTSLVDAFRVLRETSAKIKHCILFSDAADAEEKAAGEMADGAKGAGTALDLVGTMRAERITVSVVGLGGANDKDVPFLKLLADGGGGRFYLTEDARNLPQIFSTETMKVAQSSLVEEPTAARPAAPSPITAGLDWEGAPLLLGYHATKPKPTAEVALLTETGEPLLATWRYGLGQTAAWTSDAKARWAAEWVGSWPGYGKFWAQFARALLRRDARGGFAVRATETTGGERLRLEIDAVSPEGQFRDGLTVTVAALDPASGESRAFPAVQTGPGLYRAEVPLTPNAATATAAGGGEGSLMLAVSAAELSGERPFVLGHARSVPAEFRRLTPDENLLRELAETTGVRGRFNPVPEEVFRVRPAVGGRGGRVRDLTGAFLLAALLWLPVDVFLRRRTWQSSRGARVSVREARQTASVP